MIKTKYKVALKMGILFGVIGFVLTLLFWYLTTATFDWRFPATIGLGFFGGGFLVLMLKGLYERGEERKANLVMLIVIGLLVISQIYSLATGQIRGPTWKIISAITTATGCIFVGYVVISLLIKKNNL